MMTRSALLWVISAITLMSCAGQPVTDENSPYYRMPLGTTIDLRQDLTVPANSARVFLQGGKVVEKTWLQIYHPHCNFQQRTVSDGTAVIKADRFKVTAVSFGDDLVVQSRPVVYAAFAMGADNDSVNLINRYVRYTLVSQNQPQVMYLTCHGGFQIPFQAQYPSLTDIRNSLGGLVAIELP